MEENKHQSCFKGRKRSFNNVAENADETKIGQFAQIVEKLTGDSVSSTTVTVVDEIAK